MFSIHRFSLPIRGNIRLHRLLSSQKESTYQFVDKIIIEARGGKGGDGCVSFEGLSPGKKRPSGGGGGRGGSVFLVADKNVSSLNFATIHFNAPDGKNGGSKQSVGRNGSHLYIKVPLGTILSEYQHENAAYPYDEVFDEEKEFEFDDENLFDADESRTKKTKSSSRDAPTIPKPDIKRKEVHLDKVGDIVLIAEGGQSGIGNSVLAGSKHQQHSLPATKIPGQLGQERSLLLELKTIADVGLVGYPNAGKSSLLRAISNANPKVAAYPFTTLHPNIGIVEYSDCKQLSIADIPGLVDGAHENRGLGHDFLKHIERTKVLLFVVDIAGSNPSQRKAHMTSIHNLQDLFTELELYNETLLEKPKLIFVNKVDTIHVTEELMKKQEQLKEFAQSLNVPIIFGSAVDGRGIGHIATTLRTMVMELNRLTRETLLAATPSNTTNNSRKNTVTAAVKEQPKKNTGIGKELVEKSKSFPLSDTMSKEDTEAVQEELPTYEYRDDQATYRVSKKQLPHSKLSSSSSSAASAASQRSSQRLQRLQRPTLVVVEEDNDEDNEDNEEDVEDEEDDGDDEKKSNASSSNSDTGGRKRRVPLRRRTE